MSVVRFQDSQRGAVMQSRECDCPVPDSRAQGTLRDPGLHPAIELAEPSALTVGYGQLVALQPAMAEHGASSGIPWKHPHCACVDGDTTAQVEVQTTST
jgi:hypothetical protein